MRYIALFFIVLYSELHEIVGHGAMYYPMPWHATSDCTPDMSPHDCRFALKIEYPEGQECTQNSTTNGCSQSCRCCLNSLVNKTFFQATFLQQYEIKKFDHFQNLPPLHSARAVTCFVLHNLHPTFKQPPGTILA